MMRGSPTSRWIAQEGAFVKLSRRRPGFPRSAAWFVKRTTIGRAAPHRHVLAAPHAPRDGDTRRQRCQGSSTILSRARARTRVVLEQLTEDLVMSSPQGLDQPTGLTISSVLQPVVTPGSLRSTPDTQRGRRQAVTDTPSPGGRRPASDGGTHAQSSAAPPLPGATPTPGAASTWTWPSPRQARRTTADIVTLLASSPRGVLLPRRGDRLRAAVATGSA